VPEVLVSGDHAKIEKWRREQSLERTLRQRPDLLEKAELTEAERERIFTTAPSTSLPGYSVKPKEEKEPKHKGHEGH